MNDWAARSERDDLSWTIEAEVCIDQVSHWFLYDTLRTNLLLVSCAFRSLLLSLLSYATTSLTHSEESQHRHRFTMDLACESSQRVEQPACSRIHDKVLETSALRYDRRHDLRSVTVLAPQGRPSSRVRRTRYIPSLRSSRDELSD